MGLTLLLHLLTGKALATQGALASAAGALKDGLPIVEAGPAAAGIEFHQVLVQGPVQVLALGLQGPQGRMPQHLMDGLHLRVQKEQRAPAWASSFPEPKNWPSSRWKACYMPGTELDTQLYPMYRILTATQPQRLQVFE